MRLPDAFDMIFERAKTKERRGEMDSNQPPDATPGGLLRDVADKCFKVNGLRNQKRAPSGALQSILRCTILRDQPARYAKRPDERAYSDELIFGVRDYWPRQGGGLSLQSPLMTLQATGS